MMRQEVIHLVSLESRHCLYVLAPLFEIGDAWLVWQGWREHGLLLCWPRNKSLGCGRLVRRGSGT